MLRKIILVVSIILISLLTMASISAMDNDTQITSSVDSNLNATVKVNNDDHTFTGLQNQIKNANSNSKLYLDGKYKYNEKTDKSLKNGIVINKDITIVGKNGCTIDGSNLARCLYIKPGCKVVLQNIVIKNGFTTNNGAGIKIGANSKVTIKQCTFNHNVAKNSNGGAIESKSSCTIKIYSSKFKNNKATRTSSKPWSVDKKGMGSAIRTTIDTNLKIYKSTFSSNNAYLSTILVVSYTDSTKKTSNLYIYKCTFNKNKSQRSGVVYSDEFGKCTIKNSVFKRNSSPKGSGIIVLDTSKYALIKNCLFYKNKGQNGGAITIKVLSNKYSSNVKVHSCKFIKNSASNYGGAIYSVGGKLNVKKCQFKSNVAVKFGGGIYTRLGKLAVASSKFNKNKAQYAGALCLACKKASVKSSSFTKNKAYYLYGAIYEIKDNKFPKCNFKSNKVLKYSKVFMHKSGRYIKVKVTDNKDKAIEKKVKLIFSGSKKIKTKWYKTSKKKYKKIKIPKSIKGKYKVAIKVKNAKYFSKTISIKV